MIEFTTTDLLSVCEFDDVMACISNKDGNLRAEWSFKSGGDFFVFNYTFSNKAHDEAKDKIMSKSLQIEGCRGAMLHMVKNNISQMTIPNHQQQ